MTAMSVMIVENDALHRAFLKSTLKDVLPQCEAIMEAADGREAIEMASARAPDSIILDLLMPNATGVEVAKHVWRSRPETRILFWSNYSDEAYVRGVARIVPSEAVYGYVLKSASEERLKLAIRAVFLEDQYVIDREVRGVQQRAEDRLEGLTDSEYEILVDLALGLTDRAIANRRGISTRGAQSRLQHLYEKLGLEHMAIEEKEWGAVFNARTRSIFTALSRGLINPDALRRANQDLEAWLETQD